MRVNIEQLKQTFQIVADWQQDEEKSGKETNFQDIITQILYMINIPLAVQPEQNQEALLSAFSPADQDTVFIDENIMNRFLGKMADYQSMNFAFKEETHVLENIPSAAIEPAQASPAKEADITDDVINKALDSAFKKCSNNDSGGDKKTILQSAGSLNVQAADRQIVVDQRAADRQTVNMQAKNASFEVEMNPPAMNALMADPSIMDAPLKSAQALYNQNIYMDISMPYTPAMDPAMDMEFPIKLDLDADGPFTNPSVRTETLGTQEKAFETVSGVQNGVLSVGDRLPINVETGKSVQTAEKTEKQDVKRSLGHTAVETDVKHEENILLKEKISYTALKDEKSKTETDGKTLFQDKKIEDIPPTDAMQNNFELSGDLSSSKPIQVQNLQNIAEKMIDEITMLKEKDHCSLKMKLEPEQLGEIEVEFRMKDGCLSGKILVETISAKEAMDSQLQNLKDQLRDQNINLSEINIGLHQNNQEQSQSGRHGYFQAGSREQRFSRQAAMEQEEQYNQQLYSQMVKTVYYIGETGNSLNLLA